MNDHVGGEPTVLVSDRDGVRTILFNRPGVHNAQDVTMLRELDTVLAQTANDQSVRVVILGGVGRSFCSGHDLREMARNRSYADNAATAEGRYRQETELFVTPVRRFRLLPMPTVCRIQGHCLAAGLMFAASADFCVAGESSVFGTPVLRVMGVNDTEVPCLMTRVNERVAKEMIWLGRQLSAAEALAAGLVSCVVPDEQLDARCEEIVAALVAAPPEALRLSKDVFQFIADRRGEWDVGRYHFISHQLSHQTTEAGGLLKERLNRIAAGDSPVSRSRA
jgi:enoyl-CoA hydratase/carnithine racemase